MPQAAPGPPRKKKRLTIIIVSSYFGAVIDMSDDVSETVWDPDSQELGSQRLEEFNDWPDRQPDSGQIGLEVDLAEQDLISGVITEEEEEQRPCPVQRRVLARAYPIPRKSRVPQAA